MTNPNPYTELGRQAFADGESSAPIMNAAVRAAIADLPVGSGAKEIMKAFSAGWHEANLAADADPGTERGSTA